jgi:DNA-binding MarR family transcriptional regulator
MRPSTLLRIERLNALLAAFSVGDLNHADVAALLQCSGSSARNYVFELIDAGVIRSSHGQSDGRYDRAVYRLSPNRLLVDAFRASLANTRKCHDSRDALARSDGQDIACDLRQCPVFDAGSASEAGSLAARRDPLVAALFGAPRPRTTPHSPGLIASPGTPSLATALADSVLRH